MSARVDWLLAEVAAEIGVTIVEPLGGGEFGAALVRDGEGRELVLKAMLGEQLGPVFARGARLSARVRGHDYPVPEYLGTGTAAGAAWSLQERLPGEIPEPMTMGHLDQLLGFLDRHVGAAGEEGDVLGHFTPWLDTALGPLLASELTAPLAERLGAALSCRHDVALRRGDIVHGDFHHRNFLAVGDLVTAVFDWEMAWVGDGRFDLVAFADWASWNDQVPDDVTEELRIVAERSCDAKTLALLSAIHTTGVTEFYLRVHPDWVPQHVANVEATTARWLDAATR